MCRTRGRDEDLQPQCQTGPTGRFGTPRWPAWHRIPLVPETCPGSVAAPPAACERLRFLIELTEVGLHPPPRAYVRRNNMIRGPQGKRLTPLDMYGVYVYSVCTNPKDREGAENHPTQYRRHELRGECHHRRGRGVPERNGTRCGASCRKRSEREQRTDPSGGNATRPL